MCIRIFYHSVKKYCWFTFSNAYKRNNLFSFCVQKSSRTQNMFFLWIFWANFYLSCGLAETHVQNLVQLHNSGLVSKGSNSIFIQKQAQLLVNHFLFFYFSFAHMLKASSEVVHQDYPLLIQYHRNYSVVWAREVWAKY